MRHEFYRSYLVKYLGWSGGEPGVVGLGEGGAGVDGGVGAGPELQEGVGRGVVEALFAEDLEGLPGGGLGIWDEAVDGFLAVDVGGVLVGANVGVGEGLGEGFEGEEDEGEDDEGLPNRFARGCARWGRSGAMRRCMPRKPRKKSGSRKRQVKTVPETTWLRGVVAQLVAEEEGDFVGGDAGDGGVPDDDAFRGSEAGDVGVEAGDFVAGAHEEHALGRDGDAGAGDYFLKLLDEGWVRLREGLEVVEGGIDGIGRGEDTDDDADDSEDPEAQPPAVGRAADRVGEAS